MNPQALLVACAAGAVALTGSGVAVARSVNIPETIQHDVNGTVTVDVNVDVTVHTPDLGDLQLVPPQIKVVVPPIKVEVPTDFHGEVVVPPSEVTVREAR